MIRGATLLLDAAVLVPAPAGAGTTACQGQAATVVGPAGGTAQGTGVEELRVNSDARVAWSLVNGRGLLTVGRNDPAVVAGFESVDLRLVPVRAVTFTGRAAGETVLARTCGATLAGRRATTCCAPGPRGPAANRARARPPTEDRGGTPASPTGSAGASAELTPSHRRRADVPFSHQVGAGDGATRRG